MTDDWNLRPKTHVVLWDNANNMERCMTVANLPSLGCFEYTMQLCIQPKMSSYTDGAYPKEADMLLFIKHNLTRISFKY